VRLNRRDFCAALAVSAAAQACASEPEESVRATLARLLGLTEQQTAWLESLSPAGQRELRDGLLSPAPNNERGTIALLMKVFGPRDRLFAYVGYPELPRIGACDGLLRE